MLADRDRNILNPGGSGRGELREPEPACVDATGWFDEVREIVILYGSARYRLRLTQNGKLILTK